jgi:hypothetical protein
MVVIDLKATDCTLTITMPIVAGWGQYKGERIYTKGIVSGMYRVQLGKKPVILRPATVAEVDKAFDGRKKFAGYVLGTEAVPTSFEACLRKNIGQSINVNFLNQPLFSVVIIAEWEDGRFYSTGQSFYQGGRLERMKEAFEGARRFSDIEDVTPELRFYYLLCKLQEESYDSLKYMTWLADKDIMGDEQVNKRVNMFQNTFDSRLERSIIAVGGELINYNRHGQDFIVQWKVGTRLYRSIIKDNKRFVSAGHYLSQNRSQVTSSIYHLSKIFKQTTFLQK